MIAQFGKAGIALALLAAGSALALGLRRNAFAPMPFAAWVFDPSSARSYERLGDVQVDLLPARILSVRVMAAALAKLPCAADVVELEAGASRRGLKPLPPELVTPLRHEVPKPRLELWREGDLQLALPRDVHPVVLAYRADLWKAAGVDLDSATTWQGLMTSAAAFERETRAAALELPRGDASIVLLLLQQRGISLAGGLAQPAVSEALTEYAGWLRGGIGIEPARRVELTAEALAAGKLGAVLAPDWKLGQLRRLLPAGVVLTIRPLPGTGPTPTWGGTGAGVPLWQGNPQPGFQLLKRVMSPESQTALSRYREDGIVSPLRSDWHAIHPAMQQVLSNPVGIVPISGEPTAAVHRELNAVMRSAVGGQLSAEAILTELRAADARLKRSFPDWGRP